MKRGIDDSTKAERISLEKRFATYLDFFSGFFFGVGVVGGIACFVILQATLDEFFALLVAIGFGCVLMFFGLVAKALSLLLKHIHS